MFASEFIDICEKHEILKAHFQGAHKLTGLKKVKNNQFLLWNSTDDVGQHWRILYKPEVNILECFDPLGISKEMLVKIINFDPKSRVIYNSSAVQPQHSQLCGYYCLWFIITRLLNADQNFEEILNEQLGSDLNENEKIILNSLRHLHLIGDT